MSRPGPAALVRRARVPPTVGGPPRVVVSHEEVTERKLAEDQVRRLNEQLNRRLGRTKALRRIDAAITNSRDPGRALALVVEEAIGQLGVDAADILICGEAAGAMEFAIGLGIPPGAPGHGATDPGGLAGRVVRVGLPLFVPDLAQAPVDGPRKRRLVAEGFVTYHAIPLMAEGRVKGVLECFRRAAMEPDSEWLAFAAMLAEQAAIAIDNAALFEDLRRSNEELKVAYDSTIEGWARALDLRDRDTEGHSRRVTEMALAPARDMGLGEAELVHFRRGALLHDMGKLGVPDAILHKPGPLSEEEWVVMRRHPSYAVEILWPIEFLGPALDIPHYHHERWDGTGYPCGLAGERIPLAARIFAAVDIWDALSHDRPYRRAWPQARVREHLRSLSGTHLDPRVVDAFLGLLAAAEPASPTEPAVSSSAAPNSARRSHGPLGRLDQGVVAPGFVARIAGGRAVAVQGRRDVGRGLAVPTPHIVQDRAQSHPALDEFHPSDHYHRSTPLHAHSFGTSAGPRTESS